MRCNLMILSIDSSLQNELTLVYLLWFTAVMSPTDVVLYFFSYLLILNCIQIFSAIRGQWKAATQSQEFFRTLQRYYNNAYMDAMKQDAINV